MTEREWVVGFRIDRDSDLVVLVHKNRPPWMRGLLNGVGGKVETADVIEGNRLALVHAASDWASRELAVQIAMAREFDEETGVSTEPHEWRRFVTLHAVTTEDRSGAVTSDAGLVHFLRSFGDVDRVRTLTDESIVLCRISKLGEPGPGKGTPVPNLLWLLPLALHTADEYDVVHVHELSTTLRAVVLPTEA